MSAPHLGFTTQLVHTDRLVNRPAAGAVHHGINTSVLFHYEEADDLRKVFQGELQGHAYSRQSCPSISALQNILSGLEQGVGCLTFASGMAAITSTLMTLLKAGDHLIMSQFVFGNTLSLKNTLASLNIEISLVDVTNLDAVKAALRPATKVVLTETIANPVTQIADLQGIGSFCQAHDLVYVVDNTLTPPYLFKARDVNASLIVSSLSKFSCGHGNVLGGAVIDTGLYPWLNFNNISEQVKMSPQVLWGLNHIKKFGLRDMGACLSSYAAHNISLGLETLSLRLERACNNALTVAHYLQQHKLIKQVHYPGLITHPQYQRSAELFTRSGAIVSAVLDDQVDPYQFLNRLTLFLTATHVGDNRSLALPVASTIYHECGKEIREMMSVDDNLIRFSMGIEDVQDLLDDLDGALLLA